MLVVSTREFRQNQRSYLDQIDNGMELLLQRGHNRCYKISPITEDDTIVDKEYILAPDEDFFRAISIEEFTARAKEHIRELYKRDRK